MAMRENIPYLSFIKLFQNSTVPINVRASVFTLHILLTIHIIKAALIDFYTVKDFLDQQLPLQIAVLYFCAYSLPPIILWYLTQNIQDRKQWAKNTLISITLFFAALYTFWFLYPLMSHDLDAFSRLLQNPIFAYLVLIPTKFDSALIITVIVFLLKKDSKNWFHKQQYKQEAVLAGGD